MDSLTNAVGAVAGASEGFYALVKKNPYTWRCYSLRRTQRTNGKSCS